MENTKPIHTIYHQVTVDEENLLNFMSDMTYDKKQTMMETLTSGRTPFAQTTSSPELQLLRQIVQQLSPQISEMGMFGGKGVKSQAEKQQAVDAKKALENQPEPTDLQKPTKPGKP